jgi:hypothetical protein
MASASLKPTVCRVCGGPLEQRPVGRPRVVCSRPACQRQAEADTRRSRRRRLAGIAASWQYDAPQPRGGHDSIPRRIARRLAADLCPSAQPTAAELSSLERIVRLGATPGSLTVTRAGRIRGIPAALPRADRRVLGRFVRRCHETAQGRIVMPATKGSPADRSRRRPARASPAPCPTASGATTSPASVEPGDCSNERQDCAQRHYQLDPP